MFLAFSLLYYRGAKSCTSPISHTSQISLLISLKIDMDKSDFHQLRMNI